MEMKFRIFNTRLVANKVNQIRLFKTYRVEDYNPSI